MVAILKEKGQPFYVITAGLNTVLKNQAFFHSSFKAS